VVSTARQELEPVPYERNCADYLTAMGEKPCGFEALEYDDDSDVPMWKRHGYVLWTCGCEVATWSLTAPRLARALWPPVWVVGDPGFRQARPCQRHVRALVPAE
jgi:hypothetical protein